MRFARVLTSVAIIAVVAAFIAVTACSQLPRGFESLAAPDASAPVPGPSFEDGDGAVTVAVSPGGGLQDIRPVTDASGCTPEDGGPGPIVRVCAPLTANECDGNHDWPGALNGTTGNGFDDDCDGQVDEGCACPSAGVTKDCYLVPPSQIDNLTGKPVGWCATNSRGTMECGGGERRVWSGECRGARAPYADDVCSPGDFDCDGKELNSKTQNCFCKDPVQCPSDALETVPYPPSGALPLKVDGAGWLRDPSLLAQTADWSWTLRGGDCDNILPHPTFGIYASPDGTVDPASRTVSGLGSSGKEQGVLAKAPQIGNLVYPAFSLSGDYFIEGKFTLSGKPYSCLQKLRVRAPGLRAEACWDTEPDGVDLDLHLARVDPFPLASACPQRGWAQTCSGQDCFYGNCVSNPGFSRPQWGYPPAATVSACQGWGSMATGATCENPRLDRDSNGLSGKCDGTRSNPNQNQLGSGVFCGPENINIDAPVPGSKYVVGLKYYSGAKPTKGHVNIYCNGERVLSSGFNPITGDDHPILTKDGADTSGDMWKVAMVTVDADTADGGSGIVCRIDPVSSQQFDATKDGSPAYCVDNSPTNGDDAVRFFTQGGYTPADGPSVCFH